MLPCQGAYVVHEISSLCERRIIVTYIVLRFELRAVLQLLDLQYKVMMLSCTHALAGFEPATRDILESLVAGEEHHLDWIETQQSMIADMGIERYLLAQVGD